MPNAVVVLLLAPLEEGQSKYVCFAYPGLARPKQRLFFWFLEALPSHVRFLFLPNAVPSGPGPHLESAGRVRVAVS